MKLKKLLKLIPADEIIFIYPADSTISFQEEAGTLSKFEEILEAHVIEISHNADYGILEIAVDSLPLIH